MQGYYHDTSDDCQEDIQKPDLKGDVPGHFAQQGISTVHTPECIHNIGGKAEIFAGLGHHIFQSISPDSSEKEAHEALPEMQAIVNTEYARTYIECTMSVHHHLPYTMHHVC
jgi:hypothetical protein